MYTHEIKDGKIVLECLLSEFCFPLEKTCGFALLVYI